MILILFFRERHGSESGFTNLGVSFASLGGKEVKSCPARKARAHHNEPMEGEQWSPRGREYWEDTQVGLSR